jgi:hypothetical protein
MSTTDGTTGGQRPSARKALISAAAWPERSASRVTAPESSTNTDGACQLACGVR